MSDEPFDPRYGIHTEYRKRAIALLASGLTQTEIAQTLDVSQTSISRWLKGVPHDQKT